MLAILRRHTKWEKYNLSEFSGPGPCAQSTLLLGACNANAAPPANVSDTVADTAADAPEKAPEQTVEAGAGEQGGSIAERSMPAEAFDLMNPRARNFTDLSGKWNYLPDPFREGLRKKVLKQYSIFNDQDDADVAPHDLKEYDFAKAPTLNVPGSWTAQVPELSWYENLVWLRKRFRSLLRRPGSAISSILARPIMKQRFSSTAKKLAFMKAGSRPLSLMSPIA